MKRSVGHIDFDHVNGHQMLSLSWDLVGMVTIQPNRFHTFKETKAEPVMSSPSPF